MTNLTACVDRVSEEFTKLYTGTGNRLNLQTVNKESFVAAINEVVTNIGTVQSGLLAELTARLLTLKNEILGGAAAAYDTMIELQQFLQANDSQLAALLAALANRVRFDEAQTLNDTQKLTARTNIGAVGLVEIGDLSWDCVAAFNAAIGTAGI